MTNRRAKTAFAVIILAALSLPFAGRAASPAPAKPPAGVCVSGPQGAMVLDRASVAKAQLKTFAIGVVDLDAKAITDIADRLRSGGAGLDLDTVIVRVILDDEPNRFAIIANKKVRYFVQGYFVRYPTVDIVGAPATKSMAWSSFYADAGPVACDAAKAASDPVFGAPKPTPPVVALIGGLRVRGTPDQLAIPADVAAFSGATSATLSALRDGVARTTAYKVIGSVGYPIVDQETPSDPTGSKAILFGNVNYAATRNFSGTSKPPQSNEIDAGMVLGHWFKFNDPLAGEDPSTHQPVVHESLLFMSLTPDYLWNANDHSEIFSADLSLTPRLGIPIGRLSSGTPEFLELNGYRNVGTGLFSWEPLVVLKFDSGTYARLGTTRTAASDRSIARGGVQLGINVLSDDKNLPFTINASYIYLNSLTRSENIGYLSTAITFSPASSKNFGVTLNYNNGNLEATGKRQEQTTVGLSVKY